jgi:branched-subunit amino acid aminotransferase/4-amino-4-deoxychorismate lyase
MIQPRVGNEPQEHVEAASLPLSPSGPQFVAGAKARRAAKRAARLMSDAERFERAAERLEAEVEPDCWQVRHLRRSAQDLRRLAHEEAARLRPSSAAA